MNTLYVCDNYSGGGMENRLHSKIAFLNKRGWGANLLTGNVIDKQFDTSMFNIVCDGVNTGLTYRFENLISAIDKIKEIIRQQNIDIVESHSVDLSLPAFIAAKLTGCRFVQTIHGPLMLPTGGNPVLCLFFYCYIVPLADLVILVSEELKDLLSRWDAGNLIVLPNSVSRKCEKFVDKFTVGKWAVVSRISPDKLQGLIEFIDIAISKKIDQIDVIGDGESKQDLLKYINKTNSICRINVLGWQQDVVETLKSGEYELVGAMGRAALEALCLNVPVILLGYDGIKGLFDKKLFNQAAYSNFSGRGINNIEYEELVRSLDNLRQNRNKYELENMLISSEEEYWKIYVEEIAFENKSKRVAAFAGKFYKLLTETDSQAEFYLPNKVHFRFLPIILFHGKFFSDRIYNYARLIWRYLKAEY